MSANDIDSLFNKIDEIEDVVALKASDIISKFESLTKQLRDASVKVQQKELSVRGKEQQLLRKFALLEKDKDNLKKERDEFHLMKTDQVILRCDRCYQHLIDNSVTTGFDRLCSDLRRVRNDDLGNTPCTRFDFTDSSGLRLWYSSYKKPSKSRPFTESFVAPHIECFEDGFGYTLRSEGLDILIKLTAIRRKDQESGKEVSLPIWEVFSTTFDRWLPWMDPIFRSAPLNSKNMADIVCPRIVVPNDEEISRGVMWVLLLTEDRFGISLTVGNPQLIAK